MFDEFIMSASHSRRPIEEDTIFRINREAQQAALKYGPNHIVNATVGSLLDDEGKLAVLPTVIDVLKGLDAEDFSAYAPIAGIPDFLQSAKKAAFREWEPQGFKGVVATPGGTGAIRHTIWNYSEYGDTVLTADWYWGPYRNISEEHGRKIETFTLFDEKYQFNMGSFSEKVEEILTRQGSIVILLNSPANNPTGYNLSDEEWEDVIKVLKDKASKNDNKIILFIDIAYIDYSGDLDHRRDFLLKFNNLPENILVVFGFSMSKSYTLYGMRCGAMIGLSSNETIAEEFRAVNEFSNRGTWSNGTRPAMMVLDRIVKDKSLFEMVENEREILWNKLLDRAAAFEEQSKTAGLQICPYKSGFFISIPCKNSKQVVEHLKKDKIFAVPLSKGIRFAICSVPEDKCSIVPAKIVDAMQKTATP